ncbi:MAG: PKD domain-containing protein [Flavobacteriia bacterium]
MKKIFLLFSVLTVFASCKKEDPKLGDAPVDADALFTYSTSTASENIINFSSANQDVMCIWDFGNGTSAEGNNPSATYPYAGVYTVKLTVFASGGSKSSTKQITIAQDDLTLLNNPFYNKLTGGTAGPGFKVWYIDSASAGHFGVGPDPESALGPVPEWYAAGENEKGGTGLYNDRYTFYLNAFKFDMQTKGEVYVHNSLAANFPGSFVNLGDYTAPLADQLNASWQLVEGEQNTITISNNAFIGFYTGVQTYRIVDLTDSTMTLQYKHHAGGLNWYLKLKSI